MVSVPALEVPPELVAVKVKLSAPVYAFAGVYVNALPLVVTEPCVGSVTIA